ncbi:flagellar biosynthesis protein FlhF [Pseudogracilibacillus sp. ICA-222130]|uniref:flagellar biosynthesis protein FlhF n=1 Tax=Pseudogracilibacillus sp. ICA-222130 TaxID=3134655 RepID=UPI0030BD398F
MKIKKYVAHTMKDAMQKIRAELGTDAVILSSKEVKKGGFLGFFEKKQYEVIAAIEKQPIQRIRKEQRREVANVTFESNQTIEQAHILSELKEMKRLLASQTIESKTYPPLYQPLFTYLEKQYIERSICEELVEHILEQTKNIPDLHKDLWYKELQLYITDTIQAKIPSSITTDKKIIQFVGPTGVGKTTTLAKIAAMFMMEHQKKIAFITTDTYRIAAIEQLKTYAKILHVPVEVAYSMEDYERALQKFDSYDAIFVDTAGRNFRDEKYVQPLKTMLSDHNDQVISYLVLSLTAKNEDMMDIFKQFQLFGVKDIIFTKMDETSTYGPIINLLWTEDVRLAYMTDGQDVPEDVIIPSAEQISELVVSRDLYE